MPSLRGLIPLAVFLLLGLGVFALESWRDDNGAAALTIEVTPEQIAGIQARWAAQWDRPPTEDELAGLIDDAVKEEVLYREALRLGLDRDDTIVRRRLAQKMTFMLEDGAAVEIAGLPRTLTDVLLRVRWLDGSAADHLLRPEAPRVSLSTDGSSGLGIPAYLRLGVEHLLFGFDHILFVVGLMFFVRRPRHLVQVVTAFTVAHSITLALSTLGVLTLSQRPVEAVIALSILFLAVELTRGTETDRSLMGRWPWAIAFGFGLLHGFGFAGALSEIGLPQQARAMALFLFNVGVEVGQLLVVGILLALVWLVRRSRVELPVFATQVPVYVMGAVSAYWFIDRVIAII